MKKIIFIVILHAVLLLTTENAMAVHGTPCTGDAQCSAEPNVYCIGGLGVCAPIQNGTTCLNDADCTSPLKPSCNAQTDLCEQGTTPVCPQGQVFNVNENKCIPAGDNSCPSGYYFDDNTEQCQKYGTLPGTTECNENTPCSDNKKKCINNVCVSLEFGGCLTNADCAPGLTCIGEGSKKTCTGTISKPLIPFTPIAPILQIPIPTLKEFSAEDVKIIEKDGEEFVRVPFIALYVVALYRYGVSIAFIVSIVMIMIAGLRWMTAGGNAAIIGQAKNMITTTVVGVLLLLGSYVLLNTINPDLLHTGALDVKYIKREFVKFEDSGDSEDELASELYQKPEFFCPGNGNDLAIPEIVDSLNGKVTYRFGGKGGQPPYKEVKPEYLQYNNSCPSGTLCLDCSGFAKLVLKCAGLSVPTGGTKGFWGQGERVTSIDSSANTVNGIPLQNGDLLGYDGTESSNGVGHVYIYIGNGQLANSRGGHSGRRKGGNPKIVPLPSDTQKIKRILRVSL